MKGWNRRDTAVVIFVLVAASSLVVAAFGTVNYLRFYPALQSLRLQLADLTYTSQPDLLNGTATFTILNPTPYEGLAVRIFEGVFNITLNRNTTLVLGSVGYVSYSSPIPPGVIGTIRVPFRPPGFAASSVYDTLASGGEVRFDFVIDLILSTFLDKVSGVSVTYICEATQGQGTCEQAYVQLLVRPAQGLGGGGGGGGV